MTDIREKVMEFERQRQMLMGISMQKQQLEANVAGLTKSLEELDKTTEEKVYKAAGPILVLREKKEVKKEIEEMKETQSLRIKTLDKQEKSLLDKLNALRTEIESEASTPPTASSPMKENDTTVISSKKE
ncbi:MAG: prefoldin subunit [Candidatus Diapherotrites archaeon]